MSSKPDALESATSGEGFRRGDEGPTFPRGLRTRERESASVAFRVQAAAGPMPSILNDKEDAVGSQIKALPSRKPEVSTGVWNDVYTPADDLSRLKWSGEVKVVILEVAKECRGGTYITVDDRRHMARSR